MSCNKGIILSAGEGTRMKSTMPKVLHKVCGKPLVQHVMDQVRAAGVENIILIVGHGAEDVKAAFAGTGVEFVMQAERLGTGHAVMQAKESIPSEGDVLVLCGDTPLITGDTVKAFIAEHEGQRNDVTVLTAVLDDPFGYGRIIRTETGEVRKIVEQKDADESERAVKEINSGMYCFDAALLKEKLACLKTENSQREYYLTDIIGLSVESGKKVGAFVVSENEEIIGVNDRIQLAHAEKIMRGRINEKHMRSGVTFIDPETAYIDADVVIGRDTVIYPGTIISGNTTIGESCVIGQNSHIVNSSIGDGADIQSATVLESTVGKNTNVGPYAYLRPNSKIGNNCKVGDFVEIKNASLGNGSKAAHLAYIGDADVGENVNIGCGVVFVNYDGVHKYRSVVKDRAFVGSNVNVVAPVTIEEDAYIAAGTTVTVDVAEGALCVGRQREEVIEGWVSRKGLLRK